jgi:hypothetical protein
LPVCQDHDVDVLVREPLVQRVSRRQYESGTPSPHRRLSGQGTIPPRLSTCVPLNWSTRSGAPKCPWECPCGLGDRGLPSAPRRKHLSSRDAMELVEANTAVADLHLVPEDHSQAAS